MTKGARYFIELLFLRQSQLVLESTFFDLHYSADVHLSLLEPIKLCEFKFVCFISLNWSILYLLDVQ